MRLTAFLYHCLLNVRHYFEYFVRERRVIFLFYCIISFSPTAPETTVTTKTTYPSPNEKVTTVTEVTVTPISTTTTQTVTTIHMPRETGALETLAWYKGFK